MSFSLRSSAGVNGQNAGGTFRQASPPPAPVTLLSDLLAFYRLNDSLTDFSGRGNHLKDTGATFFGSGLIGGRLATNGGWVSGLAIGRRWSFSMWVRPNTSGTGNGARVQVGTNDNTPIFTAFSYHQLLGDTLGKFSIGYGTEPDVQANIDSLAWSHLVVTQYGYVANCYVNGALIDTLAVESALPGRFTVNASGTVTHPIDLVGLWSRVLSADEVTELYNAGAGLDPTA